MDQIHKLKVFLKAHPPSMMALPIRWLQPIGGDDDANGVGCSMGKWSFFGHEGARVTFIRLGLVMLLPWGSQLTGRLRAPPGPAETGCNPLPHVRTAISERTIARAAAAIVSAFEAFTARS